MRTSLACLLFATSTFMAGCPTAPGGEDLRMPVDMALNSCCGMPGDKGNELGVGLFCRASPDCKGTGMFKAFLCSSAGNTPQRSTYFCTFLCEQQDGGSNQCGTGASCQCDGRGCACVPDICVTNPIPGCS
ncbi:MAG: hypothetical protein RMK29_15385 [Myxococcales bacterium]|nr:hypothetical protein [Myxococcales bacterium]